MSTPKQKSERSQSV